MFVVLALLLEWSFPQIDPSEGVLVWIIAWVLVGWSILYFASVIIAIPFLTSEKFWPNPTRLFFDGLVSICQSVLVFAVAYRLLGIEGDEGVTVSDHVYFSAVTFSTLGYGDFRPAADARLLAASQAIIGNLHLGIIVGAAFFAAQRRD